MTCLTLQLQPPAEPAPAAWLPEMADSAPDRAGEQFSAAVTQLYEVQYARLFHYLDRLSGDAELAADVAQEAFVRLYLRGTLPEQSAAWLVTVATNLLRDEARRTSRRRRLLEAAPESVPLPAAAADPAGELLAGERRATVRRVLAQLAPRDRQALLMRHAGYSYREIAGALSLAETGIGSVLLRAMKAFRLMYKRDGGTDD